VLLCLGIGLSSYIQKLSFAISGENLTYKLRVRLFKAILNKNIGWFENKSTGNLTNILTEDITSINGLTTETLGVTIEAVLGLFFSCLICFLFSWQVGLVVCATSPFMVIGGIGMSRL
jgi:ABC-type multidrug transport system fused ATPase/permease subunit